MTQAPQHRSVPHYAKPARGFTLIELLIAVLVGLVVVAGLLVTVGSMSSTFNAQGAMSLMQDSQRMMLGILNNTVRSAGYIVNPLSTTSISVFPASTTANADGSSFAAGQSIVGTDPAALGSGATTPNSSTLNIRYQSAVTNANGVVGLTNCRGEANTGTSNIVYTNAFSVANNQLLCSVNGDTPVPLVDNVLGMTLTYGVDTTGGSGDPNGYVNAYETASQVQAAGQWNYVLSVRFTICFINSGALNNFSGNANSCNVLTMPTPTAANPLPATQQLMDTVYLMNNTQA